MGCMDTRLISIHHSVTQAPHSFLIFSSFHSGAIYPSQPPSHLSPPLTLVSFSLSVVRLGWEYSWSIYRSGRIDLWLGPLWENRSTVKLTEGESLASLEREKKTFYKWVKLVWGNKVSKFVTKTHPCFYSEIKL